MTGFSALPLAEEGPDSYVDESQWAGSSRILGPRWSHLPSLTISLLGVQIFWSVEMSYGKFGELAQRLMTNTFACFESVAIFIISGFNKILDGNRLPRWTGLGPHHATSHRSVLAVIAFA